MGFPNGWLNLEVKETFRFFHSSTELVDPDTSKIKRLLSEMGIDTARAGEVALRVNRVALSPVSARTEDLRSLDISGTLRGLNMIGKTFFATNLALLAGIPKAKVLNPELPIFGVGIYGHPEANMGEFGRNHVFVVRLRFAPAPHHL
jgi:hypothetical protein